MKYFSLKELCRTNTGFLNIPNQIQNANLQLLIEKVLDPARELLGEAITVNSGFRSPMVNNAVKGAKKSQHLTGQAADIKCSDNKKLFELIRDNFEYDQLINEHDFSWIHVSFSSEHNRKQILNIV